MVEEMGRDEVVITRTALDLSEKPTIYRQSDQPSNPADNSFWLNTDDGTLKQWDGSTWQTIQIKGDQGTPGAKGADGQTSYTHIAYADDAEGNGFSQDAGSKAYIGIYTDFTQADSTDPSKYQWNKIQGPQGPTGPQGPKGDKGDDNRANVFTSQPKPPYAVNDLWLQSGATYYCVTARSSGSFNQADWALQKLVIGSLDSSVQNSINTAASNALSSAKSYTDSAKSTVTNQLTTLQNIVEWQTITSATDLNNLKTTGHYLIKGTLTNSPVSAWIYLIVNAADSTRIIQQVWKDNDPTKLWQRVWQNTKWLAWTQLANSNDVANAINSAKSYADSTYGNTKSLVSGWNASGTTLIDGGKIKTNSLSADAIYGGELVLGGENNQNGIFYVNTANGDNLVYFGSDACGIDTLHVGQLISDSVVGVNEDPLTYSVSNSTDESIADILNDLPYVNNDVVTINLTGDDDENIVIKNFLGNGKIILNLNGHKLNGYLKVLGCTVYVQVNGGTVNATSDDSNNTIIENYRSTFIDIINCKLYGNSLKYGVVVHGGGSTTFESSEVYNVQETSVAYTNGRLTVRNCKGKGSTYGLHAFYGGYIIPTGTIPGGDSSNVAANASGIVDTRTSYSVNTGSASAPASPKTTKTWSATSADDYSSSYGWMGEGYPKQGSWGYGLRTGFWFFGSGPQSTLKGKNISSIKVWVKRQSSGGVSGNVSVVLRWHSYTSKPSSNHTTSSDSKLVSLSWGQSAWVTLPSSFISAFKSGSAAGIGIYTSSSSRSNYACMSASCKLQATYQ